MVNFTEKLKNVMLKLDKNTEAMTEDQKNISKWNLNHL